MFSIGICYLTGFAAATDPDDRETAEWPPHPGRLFMAMAAAHFETGEDVAERAALEWVEGLGAPHLHAPGGVPRALVTHYVPVNDSAGPSKALLQSAPLSRDRQPRTFARTWLDEDATVWMLWPEAGPTPAVCEALTSLCSKVTRIGHSSSLVQVWVEDGEIRVTPNWVPDSESGTNFLRVATSGTLEELERRYDAGLGERYEAIRRAAQDGSGRRARKVAMEKLKSEFGNQPPTRRRPQLSAFAAYAPVADLTPEPEIHGSVFSPHLLPFTLERVSGPYNCPDLLTVLAVCERWHEALCSQCDDLDATAASLLSGHTADGRALQDAHLAFVPLAFVGHPHADGRLLGMGLALPEKISAETRRKVALAVARVRELKLGRLGVWRVASLTGQRPALNLRGEAWTAHPKGATHWATVTPIAFDQHAKSKDRCGYQAEVAGMVRTACGRMGLPEPREVIVTPVSAHLGAPPSHAFPKLLRKDGSQRRHSHAILVFPEPVRGPILLGAGRYRGYGLCRPLGGES